MLTSEGIKELFESMAKVAKEADEKISSKIKKLGSLFAKQRIINDKSIVLPLTLPHSHRCGHFRPARKFA